MAEAAITKRRCIDCGNLIKKGRIEALPKTVQCVDCAAKSPREVVYLDPDELCAKASETARNGFGKSD